MGAKLSWFYPEQPLPIFWGAQAVNYISMCTAIADKKGKGIREDGHAAYNDKFDSMRGIYCLRLSYGFMFRFTSTMQYIAGYLCHVQGMSRKRNNPASKRGAMKYSFRCGIRPQKDNAVAFVSQVSAKRRLIMSVPVVISPHFGI